MKSGYWLAVHRLLPITGATLFITACPAPQPPVVIDPHHDVHIPPTPPGPDPSEEGWFCYAFQRGETQSSGCTRSRSQCEWLRRRDTSSGITSSECEQVTGTVSCAQSTTSQPLVCGRTVEACRRLSAKLADNAPCVDFEIPLRTPGYFRSGGS